MSVGIQLDIHKFKQGIETELKSIHNLRRITNYLSAAQLYLKDNFLLQEKLSKDHIKERILGHWGTCPGINIVYAHCSLLIKRYDIDMFLVVGPGHGAPAVLANLYLEGSLQKYHPGFDYNMDGLKKLIKGFSWPGGFPSHINAQFPGCIHEGGELGYALAVSFGAVMDNPDLIVTCIVGDGEAETGPTATAWHSYKFIDPKESGAVIPIVHVNGFKISSETIYGSMSDEELENLFKGYGYLVRFVEDVENIDADMAASLDWAYRVIREIQMQARSGKPPQRPRWPVLILRTPKGLSILKKHKENALEGSWRAHGVPIKHPKTDDISLHDVEEWLRSYNVQEFFNENGEVLEEVRQFFPPLNRRLGNNPHTNPKYEPLNLPPVDSFGVEVSTLEHIKLFSITEQAGKFLSAIIERNPTRFRMFSPDELASNKLDAVLDVTTRNFQWVPEKANRGGRVIEVLSEHNCQGWSQGYTLTGRYALFPSYETFLGIITSMMVQFAKFVKLSLEEPWRHPIPSLCYIESSTLWRQEHNGYSHQNPMFINNLLNLKGFMVRVYFPPDANTFVVTLNHCFSTTNHINLVVGTKNEMPSLLSIENAKRHLEAGASIWKWCSTNEAKDPDVVLVGIGNEVTIEAIAAAKLLARDLPDLRIRMVNVMDLMVISAESSHPNALSEDSFNAMFTCDKPVVISFHGYPSVLRQLLFGRPHPERFSIFGYIEEGTTTTPFSMMIVNKVSRFHLAQEAVSKVAKTHSTVAVEAHRLLSSYQSWITGHQQYIKTHGKDPEFVTKILHPPDARTFEDLSNQS